MIKTRKILIKLDKYGKHIDTTYHEFSHITGWSKVEFYNGCTWHKDQYFVKEITVDENTKIDKNSGLII